MGKSFVASLIAQYLAEHDRLERCYDTDPVNGSLQTIPALNAAPVPLLEQNALNVRAVDRLVESIISAKKDVVVDNGAASFLPFSRYLVQNDIAGVLSGYGATPIVHTVVTGGANGLDTLRGLDALAGHFLPGAQLVVWVNEFFGPARFDGVDFERTSVFTSHQGGIRGVVYLRQLDREMFAPVLAEMLEQKLTFSEADASDRFVIMEKSRLFRIKSAIWEQLEAVLP